MSTIGIPTNQPDSKGLMVRVQISMDLGRASFHGFIGKLIAFAEFVAKKWQ